MAERPFYFGPEAAEVDTDILTYFHTTTQVNRLLEFGDPPLEFIFVARPGVGKTALFKWLAGKEQRRNIVVFRADETRLTLDDPESNVYDYQVIMKAELFTAMIIEANKLHSLSSELVSECETYLSESRWGKLTDFLNKRLEGLSIMGTGFSLKSQNEQRKYLEEIRNDKKIEKAASLVERLAREVDMTLVVDNPEYIVGEGLEDITRDNAIRLGSFLAALNHLHSLGIQVIVFIKEHVLQNVREHFRDFSFFSSRITGLDWTEEDLVEVIRLRLKHRLRLKWQQIFTIKQDEFRKQVLPFLINGPRDLVTICNIAGTSGQKISEVQLRRAIESMRAEKLNDIKTQYQAQWPRILDFTTEILNLFHNGSQNELITPDVFRSTINDALTSPSSRLFALRKQEDWIESIQWSTPTVDELFFLIGCLGYEFQGKRYYPWAGRSLEQFKLADAYFISPLFAR